MFSPEKPSLENEELATKYDALLVLGAVMEWNAQKKKWEFPTIIDRYAGKLVMGKARAIATKEIQDQAPLILVTGGSDKNPETGESVSRSVELARLMTERYNIPTEKVVAMGTSEAGSTLGNTENLIQYLESHPGLKKTGRIGIICPRFQHERAQLMFETNPYFKENGISLYWIDVEDVLEERHPLYKDWTDAVYNTPEAKINRDLEEKGIEDFKSGKYKPT